LITALLRAGNTHASNSCVALLKRVVGRLRERWPEVELEIRADAGFAVPALYDYCEAEDITYTVGLITNPRLQGLAEELLDEAQESHEEKGEKARLFSEGLYGAASWERSRRVVYKAEAMEKGTNTRFVVTTRTDKPKDIYEFYARRGEGENWIKDLKLHMKADRLSCHRFILRLGLIKIGGRVRELLTKVRLHLASGHPGQDLWHAFSVAFRAVHE
jgi:Transposase DDE domain group 1